MSVAALDLRIGPPPRARGVRTVAGLALAGMAALCAAVTPAQTGAAAAEPALRLRVGTWNLEQLGQRQPPRALEDYRKIAAAIAASGVDVLALQEIGGTDALERVCRFLGPDYEYCLGTTGRNGPLRRSLGLLWNGRRVELTQCEELLDLSGRVGDIDVFSRAPVCGVFRVLGTPAGEGGGFHRETRLDFRALVVHLAEGQGRRPAMRRRAEVLALRRYTAQLGTLPHEDADLVVLGDFAHGYRDPAHDALCEGGHFRYLRGPELWPTSLQSEVPIDHIAVSGGLPVVDGSFRVHDDAVRPPADLAPGQVAGERQKRAAAWRHSCSDHFLVSVDLEARRDADPDARFKAPVYGLGKGPQAPDQGPLEHFPFGPGTKVEVRFAAGSPGPALVSGELLNTPGAWVILRIPQQGEKAYPAHRILDMTRID